MLINDKCNVHHRDPVPARIERCDTCNRIRREEAISGRVVRALLKAGYVVSVFDGEEYALKASRDAKAIVAAMFSTDEDVLWAKKHEQPRSFVHLIYGNDTDVISDYGTSLESVLAPVIEYANGLA